MDELKPCPFCGEHTFVEKEPLWRTFGTITHGYYGHYEYVVRCHNSNCRCSVALGQNDTIYNSDTQARQNAIEAWNRRADNG